MVPNNIHDEFIASHQTSCEHSMPYFCYYHRHMLICVEIALNYAEEVLLGGKERLDQELYGKFSGLFDAVFERYGEIVKGYRKEKDISGDLP